MTLLQFAVLVCQLVIKPHPFFIGRDQQIQYLLLGGINHMTFTIQYQLQLHTQTLLIMQRKIGQQIIQPRPPVVQRALQRRLPRGGGRPACPLAQPGIAPGESRRHLQLVLTDRSPLTEGREFSVLSPLTWRLGDLGAKHSLLKEGLGWGNMPRAMVAVCRMVSAGVGVGLVPRSALIDQQGKSKGKKKKARKD